jgi:hypothetical protein
MLFKLSFHCAVIRPPYSARIFSQYYQQQHPARTAEVGEFSKNALDTTLIAGYRAVILLERIHFL